MTMTTVQGTRCGNRAAHGTDTVYHASPAAVKACYASTGRFAQPGMSAFQKSAPAVATLAVSGTVADAMTFEQYCEANEWFDGELSADEQRDAYRRYLAKFGAAKEPQAAPAPVRDEQAERQARIARYNTWRTIPVYTRNRGYYALEIDGTVHFFRVERPAKGQYKGRTFVTEQASDTFHKIEPWARAADILDRIARDPETAALRYAKEIERCSRCNRTLTDDDSRARGMGEDCAKKVWG